MNTVKILQLNAWTGRIQGAIQNYIKENNPDIICFQYKEITSNTIIGRTIPYRKGFYTKKNLKNEIYPSLIHTKNGTSFPFTIWAKAYNMKIYKNEQLEVDDRIKIGEDAACSIPCMVKAESMYILDKELYFYRRNNISMTKNKKSFSWDGPELIDKHLRRRILTNEFYFQEQIARRTVHALINVVKTQYYSDKTYGEITKDIKIQLERDLYNKLLKECHFTFGSEISVCKYLLEHNIYFPFFILSKFI